MREDQSTEHLFVHSPFSKEMERGIEIINGKIKCEGS
jgi:hypothetical protein